MSQPDLEDAQSTFSGTREVDPRYALDEARLVEWLAALKLAHRQRAGVALDMGGQSNPTYELTTPGRSRGSGR